MKKIIKRIVSCVLFVAILLGLLQVSSLIFQPKSNDKASGIHYPRANGIFSEPKDSIDTVFIGDSEVYHSFIPLNIWRDYGITSYDVSSPAQKLVYSMEFLKKTFENQSPKIVFLLNYDKLLAKLRNSEGERSIRDQQNALITSLNLKLSGISKKRTRLYEDFTEGVLDEEEYAFAKKAYDEQYADLSRQ